jgi:hypothetical protein
LRGSGKQLSPGEGRVRYRNYGLVITQTYSTISSHWIRPNPTRIMFKMAMLRTVNRLLTSLYELPSYEDCLHCLTNTKSGAKEYCRSVIGFTV